MEERYHYVYYKGVKIECVYGSNYVYIGKVPYINLRSAKINITLKQKRMGREKL